MKSFANLIKLPPFLMLFALLGCSSPDGPGSGKKADGLISVQFQAPSDAGNRKVFVKLYDAHTNIYDPAAEALADTFVTLGMDAKGAVSFALTAAAGEIYQIAGAVAYFGIDFTSPEKGNYLFKKETAPIDGDTDVKIGKNDFSNYSPITGGVSFRENRIGQHHVTIWESGNRKGTVSLGWIGDVDNMTFKFNGSEGAIGRVGKRYKQKYVDDMPDPFTVNVDADISFTGGGKYYFCIYGWVYNNIDWNSSTIKHEYYVIEDYNRQESDPLIGSLLVDGIEYDMHRYAFGGGSYRFKAVRKTGKRTSGPVNLKPFFQYWRKNGMENFYLEELTWAIELLYGSHKGTFYCWNIDIPL